MTLHELTGGRFVLGLGVSHPHLAQKLRGHVYDKPLTRMREHLEDYHRLPYRGPLLPDVDHGPTEPPVLLAALRDVGYLSPRIDWSRLALAGHSLGGYTVLGLAGAWPQWLGETKTTSAHLKAMLRPYPSAQMAMWPVGKAVGNVRNDSPDLFEPLAANPAHQS